MIHDSEQDFETAASGLRVGAIDWRHHHWCEAFYPDDLPDDWQLSYYANEFSTLLLPASVWEDGFDVASLLEEVPDDFVFYLQCSATGLAAMQSRCEQLAEHCGGLIVEQPLALAQAAGIYCCGVESDRGIWTPDNPATSGIGMLALGGSDMKTWRAWLEQFSRCSNGNLKALFVSDHDIEPQQLQQLKTLVELMGF